MTLFPEQVENFLRTSIIGRALQKNLFELYCHNIRDYTTNKQKQVDDYPYGGGKGMVMQAQPIWDCYRAICKQVKNPYVIYLSPKGRRFTQTRAKRLKKHENIILLCGHYEGIDQRVLDMIVHEEISVGDYILTGGELPAMIVVDTVARMLPGVLADASCYEEESIYSGLLEYPQKSRTALFEGRPVPPVLTGGNHAEIARWRKEQALELTRQRRKDLYRAYLKKNSK